MSGLGLLIVLGQIGAPAADYTLRLDPEMAEAHVTWCPSSPPPRVIPGTPKGRQLTRTMDRLRDGAATPLALDAEGRPEASLRPGDCLRWTFDPAAVSRASNAGLSRDYPEARVLWPALWLWRPARPSKGFSATVHFELPPGVAVSTPWPRRPDGRYQLGISALQRRGRVVIGRFPTWVVEQSEARLHVATLGAVPPRSTLEPWVRGAARGVASVFGRFPEDQVQVLILAEPGRGGGFGVAYRGGGGGVTVFVGADSQPKDLADDWTLVHELFHLGMPYVPPGNAWFSEGIAQYYTHVCQGRAGLISPTAAWSEVYDGFRRGAGSDLGRSLRQESDALYRRHNYWWVYWAGAAWALLLDLELRAMGRSLDEVVAHWQRHGCCGPPMSPEALLAEADALLGSSLVSRSAARVLDAKGFPDVSGAYAAMGLRPAGPKRVTLDPTAPRARDCAEIMGAAPGRSPRRSPGPLRSPRQAAPTPPRPGPR